MYDATHAQDVRIPTMNCHIDKCPTRAHYSVKPMVRNHYFEDYLFLHASALSELHVSFSLFSLSLSKMFGMSS